MAEFTIEVLNNSGFDKSYVVFSETPKVTRNGSDVEVFSNAWVTFDGIRPNGYDSLTYTDVIEAYWGTLPREAGVGVVVSNGGSQVVDTATQDSVTFSSEPLGFGNVTHGKANAGAYQIVANADFTAKDNYVFGMSKPGKTVIPKPVVTFAAEPNDTFEVIPVIKFYVSDGLFSEGEIIDVKMYSTNAATIDFTGRSQRTATVVQNDNGAFTVSYS
jgi:hypothetical protein